MHILENVLESVVGSNLTSVIGEILHQHGGVAGVVNKFEQHGLGHVVQSWVGTGNNLPVTPDQIHQVLGSNAISQMAMKLRLEPADLARSLSQLLPPIIDKLTPGGVVPSPQTSLFG